VGLGLGFGRYKNRSGYACVVARVEADAEIRLRHIWCTADAGLAINPDGVRAQLEGGIIQAASMALKEQLRIDDTGAATRSWADYPILRFSEIPPIDIELADTPDEPSLGMGECTLGPTAAAIANAASHALGLRLRDMPLTRARILEVASR
jgi:CO/xanthine dehydrogenase Mo-binding subunit